MQFTDQTQDFNSSPIRNNILFSKPMSFDDWYDVVKPDILKIDAWEEYEDYRHRNAQARLRNIDIRVTFSSNHKNPIPDRILNTEPTGKVTEELLKSYIVEDNAWYAKELSYIKRVFAMKAFASYIETVMPAIILAGITFWRFFLPREAYDPDWSHGYKLYRVTYALPQNNCFMPRPNQEIEIQYEKPKESLILNTTTNAEKRLQQIKQLNEPTGSFHLAQRTARYYPRGSFYLAKRIPEREISPSEYHYTQKRGVDPPAHDPEEDTDDDKPIDLAKLAKFNHRSGYHRVANHIEKLIKKHESPLTIDIGRISRMSPGPPPPACPRAKRRDFVPEDIPF